MSPAINLAAKFHSFNCGRPSAEAHRVMEASLRIACAGRILRAIRIARATAPELDIGMYSHSTTQPSAIN